jgi:hypothetical protein
MTGAPLLDVYSCVKPRRARLHRTGTLLPDVNEHVRIVHSYVKRGGPVAAARTITDEIKDHKLIHVASNPDDSLRRQKDQKSVTSLKPEVATVVTSSLHTGSHRTRHTPGSRQWDNYCHQLRRSSPECRIKLPAAAAAAAADNGYRLFSQRVRFLEIDESISVLSFSSDSDLNNLEDHYMTQPSGSMHLRSNFVSYANQAVPDHRVIRELLHSFDIRVQLFCRACMKANQRDDADSSICWTRNPYANPLPSSG